MLTAKEGAGVLVVGRAHKVKQNILSRLLLR